MAADTQEARTSDALDHMLAELRGGLAMQESWVRALVEALKLRATHRDDRVNASEAIAQAMLALRHVEDARMRVGKVMQYALQGGIEYGPVVP